MRGPSKADIEAVEWLLRLTEIASSSEDVAAALEEIQNEFNLWATCSPANLRGFLETVSVYEALGECGDALMRELETHIDSRGIVTPLRLAASGLAVTERSADVGSIQGRVKRSWRLAVAVAATLVFMTLSVLLFRWAGVTTYVTQAGEWRRIRLEDGSVVFLREQSEIRVSFSGSGRAIRLLRGQALFDVARDAHSPFVVRSDTAEIQALGTRFDVEHRNGPTHVTVVEGSVRVKDSQEHSLLLREEEGAEVAGQTLIKLDPLQVENTVAAHRGVVVFDHLRLSVVAERFNLDSRRQLRIADATAGEKPISGRYKTDNPQGLVLAILDLYPELTVLETEDGWVVQGRPVGGAK